MPTLVPEWEAVSCAQLKDIEMEIRRRSVYFHSCMV